MAKIFNHKKRPWVLIPAGPIGWGSHHFILPELKKIWLSLGFTLVPVWYPRPKISNPWVEQMRNECSCLIFPLGIGHYDSLWTLNVLRTKHRILIPAITMVASDLTKGFRAVFDHKSILSKNDVFVTNCTAESELLRLALGLESDVLKSQVLPIPLPVSENVFYPDLRLRRKFRRELGLSDRQKLILYAGRISSQKNIHSLILSFAKLLAKKPDSRLFILGTADEIRSPHFSQMPDQRYIHYLPKLVTDMGLESKVSFVEQVDQPTLNAFFNACDAHASLSVHSGEDYGYSIAQGILAGAPTVISRWGGHHDFLSEPNVFGVPIRLTRTGVRVDLDLAARGLERGLKRKRTFYKTDQADSHFSCAKIKLQWKKAVLTAERSSSVSALPVPIQPSDLFLRKYLEDRVKKQYGMTTQFSGPDDPLYRAIASHYLRVKPTTAIRFKHVYVDPFFDVGECVFTDPLSFQNDFKLKGIEKKQIRFSLKTKKPIHVARLQNFSWFRKLVDFGVLIPHVKEEKDAELSQNDVIVGNVRRKAAIK